MFIRVILLVYLLSIVSQLATGQLRRTQRAVTMFNQNSSPARIISPSTLSPSQALLQNLPLQPLSPALPPKVINIPSSSPSTTLITDTSPEVARNLANTLQLLTVTNTIQSRNDNYYGKQKCNNAVSSPLVMSPFQQLVNSGYRLNGYSLPSCLCAASGNGVPGIFY